MLVEKLKKRKKIVDWDSIGLEDEIDIEFNEFEGTLDLRGQELQDAQGIHIVSGQNPLALFFPDGYDPEYYQRNRRKIIDYVMYFRSLDPEYWRKYMQDYYQQNKERINAKTQSDRDNNREMFRARRRGYYQRHKVPLLKYKNRRRTKRKAMGLNPQ